MIVKMQFVNISGPRSDIDRVMDLYLSRYEIQLESALSELKTVDNLRPFVEMNPYKDALVKAVQFVGFLENPEETEPDTSLGLNDIFELIRTMNEEYLKLQAKQEEWKKKKEEIASKQKIIEPFRPMGGDLSQVLHYKYISYRFGKMPQEQYQKLEKEYIIRHKKEEYGYSCLTDQKQFYMENYPGLAIEKGNIDEVMTMMIRGEK